MKQNKKKILLLTDYPIDGIGGAEKSTLTVAKILYNEGVEVHILTPSLSKMPNKNYYYHFWGKYLGNKILVFMRKAHGLIKVVKQIRPDYVNAQFSQYGFVLTILRGIGILPRTCKYFFTDRDFLSAYNKKYQMTFKLFSHKLTGIVCTTSINEKLWKSLNSKVNTKVIHNVLEENWYCYSDEKKLKLREAVNYKKTDFVIGFSGRFASWKRWDDVYLICKTLKNNDNIKFEIAIAPLTDTDEKKYQEMLNFIDRIKKLLGNKIMVYINSSLKEMDDFYYRLDCFVLTSENESFGRTLLEAASRKCVLICTNSGGAPEVDGNNKNMYEVGNIDQVSNIILSYVYNVKKQNEDKEFFYDRFNKVFNREIFVKKNKELYNLGDSEWGMINED